MSTRERTRRPAADRQRDLLAAALERFSVDGFDGASVQDIARQAGVAAGTVYLYFPSKEHLLLGLHAEFHQGLLGVFGGLAEQLRERIDAGEPIDIAATSDQVVDALVRYSVEHRAHCVVLTTFLPRLAGSAEVVSTPDGAFAQALGELLENAAERGLIEVRHPRLAARLLATATIQTLGPAVASGDVEDLAKLTEQTKEIFRKVLASQA